MNSKTKPKDIHQGWLGWSEMIKGKIDESLWDDVAENLFQSTYYAGAISAATQETKRELVLKSAWEGMKDAMVVEKPN